MCGRTGHYAFGSGGIDHPAQGVVERHAGQQVLGQALGCRHFDPGSTIELYLAAVETQAGTRGPAALLAGHGQCTSGFQSYVALAEQGQGTLVGQADVTVALQSCAGHAFDIEVSAGKHVDVFVGM